MRYIYYYYYFSLERAFIRFKLNTDAFIRSVMRAHRRLCSQPVGVFNGKTVRDHLYLPGDRPRIS